MQYVVDAYAKMEEGRIKFLRHNQSALRVDTYKNIKNTAKNKIGDEIGSSCFTFDLQRHSSQHATTVPRQHGYN